MIFDRESLHRGPSTIIIVVLVLVLVPVYLESSTNRSSSYKSVNRLIATIAFKSTIVIKVTVYRGLHKNWTLYTINSQSDALKFETTMNIAFIF